MSVNVATQYDSALQAYLDNAGYEASGSVAEAKAFVTACVKLVALVPTMTGTRDAQIQMKVDEYRQAAESAREWIAANDMSGSTGPSVTYGDLRNSRD